VWTVPVVVINILGQEPLQVPGSEDQGAVEQLSACGAHPALRARVRSGRPDWRAQDLDRLGREHRVERGGESAVPVADEEPERSAGLGQHRRDVAGLLADPRFGGVGGDAEQVDSAGGDLDDEQDVDAAEKDGVDLEEVGGRIPVAWVVRNWV